MDSSRLFLVSVCSGLGSLLFMWHIHKLLFIRVDDQADEVDEDVPESYWLLYQLSYWMAIVCGLIAAGVIVEAVLMLVITIAL